MFLINVLLIKVLNVILYTIKFKPSNIKMSRFELFILHPLFHEIKERGNIMLEEYIGLQSWVLMHRKVQVVSTLQVQYWELASS